MTHKFNLGKIKLAYKNAFSPKKMKRLQLIKKFSIKTIKVWNIK